MIMAIVSADPQTKDIASSLLLLLEETKQAKDTTPQKYSIIKADKGLNVFHMQDFSFGQ